MAGSQKNDWVLHPDFGYGVVKTTEQDEQVEVLFDHHGRKKLHTQYANLKPAEADATYWRKRRYDTLYIENSDIEHYYGDYWIPFYPEPDAWVQKIPEFLEKSTPLNHVKKSETPVPPPERWPRGALLQWPDTEQGVVSVIKISSSEKVHDLLKSLAEEEGAEPYEPQVIHTQGMAALLPMEDGDSDEYVFQGTVQKVKEFDMLGQTGWIATTTIMREMTDEEDEDINLDIIITQRIWKSDNPPRQGEDIGGSLWHQGRLWYAHPLESTNNPRAS